MTTLNLQLTLGPVLFFWPRDTLLDFYASAADWPLDRIYLGEVVCSRRQQMRPQDWISLARDLAAAGKRVTLSCQALLESESDLRRARQLAANGDIALEANDLGAIKLAREHGLPFVAGPHLNIYNADTLKLIRDWGAERWVPPVEMDRATLAQLLARYAEIGAPIATELFAWGKLPLALSARCFTARHYNLSKDDCQFRCLEHPDGLIMRTQDQQDFLTLNGIQTLSAGCHSLLPHLRGLSAIGVDAVRVSPQSRATGDIVALFRQALDGADPDALLSASSRHADSELVDGYWRGQAGNQAIGASHAHS
ncbi:U32 family peptidase [Chromobacterium haemolyticum]|uniref:U32 family peptidase n=1 Tax=Chromobacterium TaxID=535 RepID=UPI004056B22A